jgi:hypothetical protein
MAATHSRKAGPGRPKGSLNNRTKEATEILARLKCVPIEGMALIASGKVPCGTCHGKGKTKYQPANGGEKLLERTCESCYGSKLEKISPELKGKMYSELAKYVHPQLRAIEHSGEIQSGTAEQILAARKKRDSS